ncbi:hypothetical protein F1737_08910 [Methanoplanus sp. FWC-SCC4]|uniref:Uncharacterized protein n=2 Tax=Methanochimaera problematica TaxID=2609417 RepID=A0AA97I4S2_9EURY|nr:hypothetical protein F1737_08910 [Methanoplanus sp. FWC-SCC4]
MSEKDIVIRLSGTINPEKEPELAEATKELLKIYNVSNLSKEGIRCLARREGLLPSIVKGSAPA